MKQLLPCFLVLAACTSSAPSEDPVAESSANVTVDVAPDLVKQYIQYNGHFAYEEIVLHRDATYHVILGPQIMTGSWAFDLPTSTLTLTPAEGSVAPDVLVYPVKKTTCHPSGWYPVLMNDGHKMIPYGIDPDFDAQYCELWHP